jgi:hypothetical protein
LDTFRGIDEHYVSNEEFASGVMEKSKAAMDSGFYVVGSRSVRADFSEWKDIEIIEGAIPKTLPEVAARQIAFCDIDMNSRSRGAVLLLGSAGPGCHGLAYYGYQPSKDGMGRFAEEKGVLIASLPTGQGEFGADVWTMVLAAGFSSCKLVPYVFPSGLAIVGERE